MKDYNEILRTLDEPAITANDINTGSILSQCDSYLKTRGYDCNDKDTPITYEIRRAFLFGAYAGLSEVMSQHESVKVIDTLVNDLPYMSGLSIQEGDYIKLNDGEYKVLKVTSPFYILVDDRGRCEVLTAAEIDKKRGV